MPAHRRLLEELCKVLPEYDTVLEPHWAVAGLDDGGRQLLVRDEAPSIKPDARGALAGWEATPHQRFERLLRETEIPIGVLITDKEHRLVKFVVDHPNSSLNQLVESVIPNIAFGTNAERHTRARSIIDHAFATIV